MTEAAASAESRPRVPTMYDYVVCAESGKYSRVQSIAVLTFTWGRDHCLSWCQCTLQLHCNQLVVQWGLSLQEDIASSSLIVSFQKGLLNVVTIVDRERTDGTEPSLARQGTDCEGEFVTGQLCRPQPQLSNTTSWDGCTRLHLGA